MNWRQTEFHKALDQRGARIEESTLFHIPRDLPDQNARISQKHTYLLNKDRFVGMSSRTVLQHIQNMAQPASLPKGRELEIELVPISRQTQNALKASHRLIVSVIKRKKE